MADLKSNLEYIKQEKNTKIIPENIKKGITVLGVTGNMSETPYIVTLGEITQGDPTEQIEVKILGESKQEILADASGRYIVYTNKMYIQVLIDSAPQKLIDVTLEGDTEVRLDIPAQTAGIGKASFQQDTTLKGSLEYTLDNPGALGIIASPTGEPALKTESSKHITYNLTQSIPNYNISFEFYKMDDAPYSRVVGILGPNYEVEAKRYGDIYWQGNYSSKYNRNAWNTLELDAQDGQVTLKINNVKIATKEFRGAVTGVMLGDGINSAPFTGCYKNLQIINKDLFTERSIDYELAITPTEVSVTPEIAPQTIIPNTTKVTQINVEAVTSAIDNNILPENIKKDITILGITGALEAGEVTPSEGMKQFATVEEMNASTGNKEGDLAVVVSEKKIPVKSTDTLKNILFAQTVVVSKAITDSYRIFINSGDSYSYDPGAYMSISIDINSTSARIDIRGTQDVSSIEYTSTDGVTYVSSETTDVLIKLPARAIMDTPPYTPAEAFEIMQHYFNQFDGIFKYTANIFDRLLTQCDAPQGAIISSFKAYTDTGSTIGTLGIDVHSALDDYNANILAKLQTQYDDIPIITDIPESGESPLSNIKGVPMNSKGESLVDFSKVSVDMLPRVLERLSEKVIAKLKLADTVTSINGNILPSTMEYLGILEAPNVTTLEHPFVGLAILKTLPVFKLAAISELRYGFCSDNLQLTDATNLNTLNFTNATTISTLIEHCPNVKHFPVLSFPSATDVRFLIHDCPNLTDESLDNLLQTCLNCPNISTKSIEYVTGLSPEQLERCKSLPHYQACVDAGWTFGY